MINDTKILHVIDDSKFIEMCADTFDVKGIKNTFITSNEFNTYDYKPDIIVVHFLRLNIKDKLLGMSIPIVWFFWGGDGFGLGKFYNIFLSKKTKHLRMKLAFKKGLRRGLNVFFKTNFPFIIDKFSSGKDILKLIKKIDVIVPIMPGDYYLLKQKYNLQNKMFHINYVNTLLSNIETANQSFGNNILLGNSASYTNNHIEIIDHLSEIDLSGRKVVIPINYGDKEYAKFIEHYSEVKLGEKAFVLIDFLPFDEYQKIIESCSVMIMNHKRQQGLGNIIQALCSGVRIILNKESTIYDYLVKNDFIINHTNDLECLFPLNKDEIIHNKQKCLEVFGKQTQQDNVLELINMIND
ncbi:TDP-N-acetylfucosamine:lipid II N-acetylfucosaminyltransferase [Croceibacter atlanticus]|mgnify:CR=1 FL=1|uniref:TDP-N-acetylfucosamine:lipid II N-acetylfucosaminyltransferase n=1 Tax=Croceibacter atlanticus TaxID=313588 RepID=UPI0024BAFA3D|nr:TDP-N-acetylfucosamine:lipid II N-acetylfucosaminyltransferase [Croceibacter atlanticus]